MANFYTPDTEVHLCNVPLTLNSSNQFKPNGWTLGAQTTWFNNHTVRTYSDFTFQRKDGIIRVPVNSEILIADGINYCWYLNKHYRNIDGDVKRFYCYITKIEFINENCSYLHIKTDVFQTWLFDMQLNQTFVERQTVLHDDLFKYTLPENIGDLEYTCLSDNSFPVDVEGTNTLQQKLSATTSAVFNENYYCCVFTSEAIKYIGNISSSIDTFVGGSPNPCYIYATNLQGYWDLMNKINNNGQAEAVVKCIAIPKFMCKYHALSGGGDEPITPQPPSQSGLHLNSPFSGAFHIEQTYGWQSDNTWHDGMDMWSTTADNNVYSTVKGTVVYSAFHEGSTLASSFGELVCVKDDVTGYYFLFGHLALNSRGVSYMQRVNIGDFLGVTGSTGGSTGVHLHYEVNTTDMWSNSINPVSVANAQFPNTYGDY